MSPAAVSELTLRGTKLKIKSLLKAAFTFLGWPILLFPIFLAMLGGWMNEYAIWHNGLQMPVLMPGCTPDLMDKIHQCMSATTKHNWMSDILISNRGVASLGDYLQDLSEATRTLFLYFWLAFMSYCLYFKKKLSL